MEARLPRIPWCWAPSAERSRVQRRRASVVCCNARLGRHRRQRCTGAAHAAGRRISSRIATPAINVSFRVIPNTGSLVQLTISRSAAARKRRRLQRGVRRSPHGCSTARCGPWASSPLEFRSRENIGRDHRGKSHALRSVQLLLSDTVRPTAPLTKQVQSVDTVKSHFIT
jgi:hypothetical protein